MDLALRRDCCQVVGVQHGPLEFEFGDANHWQTDHVCKGLQSRHRRSQADEVAVWASPLVERVLPLDVKRETVDPDRKRRSGKHVGHIEPAVDAVDRRHDDPVEPGIRLVANPIGNRTHVALGLPSVVPEKVREPVRLWAGFAAGRRGIAVGVT